MIKERVITVINYSGIKLPDLEERTGISRYTWSNLKNPAKSREIKEEEITAIGKIFPEFRWWIFTGEEMPEVGQVSPSSSYYIKQTMNEDREQRRIRALRDLEERGDIKEDEIWQLQELEVNGITLEELDKKIKKKRRLENSQMDIPCPPKK